MENFKKILKSVFSFKTVILVIVIVLVILIILSSGFYFITIDDGEWEDAELGNPSSYTEHVNISGETGLSVSKDELKTNALKGLKYTDEEIANMSDEEVISNLQINRKLKKKPKVKSLNEVTQAELLWCTNDVYSKYLDSPEELEKLLNAEIVTQYPDLGDVEGGLNGIIKFKRHKENGKSEFLTYIDAETFDKYINDNNSDVLNYFTLDDTGNAVIASINTTTETLESNDNEMVLSDYSSELTDDNKNSDGSYQKVTKSISKQTIGYKNSVQSYTLPFDYLWTLLVIGEDKNFVMELADLAKNSEITISIYDNLTTDTNTDVYTYKKETRTDTFVVVSPTTTYGVENVPTRGYWWPDDRESDSVGVREQPDFETDETEYKITHTVKTEINTPTIALTKANVWIVDYSVEYTYKEAEVITDDTNSKTEDDTEYVKDVDASGDSKSNSALLNNKHAQDLAQRARKYIEDHKKDTTTSRAHTIGTSGKKADSSAFNSVLNNYKDTGLLDSNKKDETTKSDSSSTQSSTTNDNAILFAVVPSYVNVDIYRHKIDRKQTTNLKTTKQEYVAQTPVNNPKDDKDADTDNFVKILCKKKHRKAKNYLTDGTTTSWLWEIMQKNCSDKFIDLTKYLFYKATGANFGVKEYDFSEFNPGSFSNTTGGIYGNTIQEKVWFMLKDLGYSDIAAAGAMGNIHYESGSFDPTLVEGGFNENNGGIGICQWTNYPRTNTSGRNTNLKLYAASKGKTWQDEDIQVEYLRGELTKGGGADGYASYQPGDRVKFYGLAVAKVSIWENATTIDEATQAFCYTFERPNKNAAHDSMSQRIAYAQQYYNSYSGKEKPLDITTNLTGDSKTKMEALLAEAQRIANDDRYTYSHANRFGELQYDCSSLVYRLYSQYFGISVPMSTSAYGTQYRVGAATSTSLQPGDVLWRSGHVTIYIGNGVYVAAHTDKVATEKQISVYNDSPSKYTYVYRFITN